MKQSKTRGLISRVNPALVLSIVAVFLALSGAAVALPGIGTVNSGDVKDNTLKSVDVKADSLGSEDLAPNSVQGSELGSIHNHVATVSVPGAVAENGAYLTRSVTAVCGPGEQLLSGGGHWMSEGANEELFISEILPDPQANGVEVKGGNDTASARTLVAVAVCIG
ncbi:hypothetical protein BH10ACT11_BH10ACT11_00490 [soil metagenome]